MVAHFKFRDPYDLAKEALLAIVEKHGKERICPDLPGEPPEWVGEFYSAIVAHAFYEGFVTGLKAKDKK